jgi:glycosyltransferase involved in cell wall biosynthesis
MPWPLDDGGRIALWQAVWSTAQRFDTVLLSLVPADTIAQPVPDPPVPLDLEIVRIPHRPPVLPVAVLRGSFGRWPYTLARYRNRRLDATLRRLVAERRPAVVVVNNLHYATYIDAVHGVPFVIRQQNLEHRWLERFAESRDNPLVGAFARFQARRMLRTETDLCARADLVLSIQDEETRILRALAPSAWVETVPIGIDFSRYLGPAREAPPVVLLVGSYGWPPNDEGARRFLAEGWPRVRAGRPDARLVMIGKDLSVSLAEAARAAGAEPVGYVDSMAPEFARASALVVPLWVGAGARVKIVEALAARLPVVSTALGAEGLDLEPGRHLLQAESPAGLGDALVALLGAPARAEEIARAAYDHALARFSLDAVARRTNELLEAAIERRARRGS